ncbi:DUF5958 family protein [Streptomyces sp. NPDC101227]|uniref:DUF5958 family protein n=1 Tax=Streptomyces sp. NPDC101227 TaxID=3366136 RepID=UPI0038035F77
MRAGSPASPRHVSGRFCAGLPATEHVKAFRVLVSVFAVAVADTRRRETYCRGTCGHAWHTCRRQSSGRSIGHGSIVSQRSAFDPDQPDSTRERQSFRAQTPPSPLSGYSSDEDLPDSPSAGRAKRSLRASRPVA